jgi:hypothetical protein
MDLLVPNQDPLIRGTDPDPSTSSKNSKKNLDSCNFVTFYDLSSWKNDVNAPSKSNMQKKKFFVGVLKFKDENSRIRIHWSEARIRIRTKGCHGPTTLRPTFHFQSQYILLFTVFKIRLRSYKCIVLHVHRHIRLSLSALKCWVGQETCDMKKKNLDLWSVCRFQEITYSNTPKYLNTVSDLLVFQRLLKYRKRNKSSKKASESYNDHYKKFASADCTTNFFIFFYGQFGKFWPS